VIKPDAKNPSQEQWGTTLGAGVMAKIEHDATFIAMSAISAVLGDRRKR